jgi:DNA polymerase
VSDDSRGAFKRLAATRPTEPAKALSIDKRRALEQVARQIASCRRCRQSGTGKPVAGEGNPDADIVFVGEAPGRREAELGRPFVGRAGRWLRRALRDIGLDEDSVYFTNAVTYRPSHRKPGSADVAHARTHLLQELEVINPRIVVLLGSTACAGALSEKVAVRDRHGATVERDGRTYLITCHPAAAARFPAIRKAVRQDLSTLKALLARSRGRRRPRLRLLSERNRRRAQLPR